MSLRRFALPLAAVFAVAMSACTPSTPPNGDISAQIEGSHDPAQVFAAAYSQTLTWQPCSEKGVIDEETAAILKDSNFDESQVECATLEAPLNWNASSEETAGTVSVEISRIRLVGGEGMRPAIFVNPGGPGESGLMVWAQTLAAGQAQDIAAEFDLIGFDPRGIARSTPLECAQPTEDEDFGAFLKTCAEQNPVAAHMGTSSVARDMDLIRHLLGQNKLNYLGYSYGTILGATYATLFPERVGRMVLDSAENSQWATPEHAWHQQVAVANALVDLTQACVTQYQPQGWLEHCPFNTPEEAAATITRLNTEPLKGSGEETLDGEALRAYLSQGLYEAEPNRAGMLSIVAEGLNGNSEAVDLILSGEFVPPALEDAAQSGALPSEGSAADQPKSEEVPIAQLMVTCHSYPAKPNLDAVEKAIEGTPANALLDTSQSSTAAELAFDTSCTNLPFVGSEGEKHFIAHNVATPILVIGLRGDHATPYQYAQALVNELGNARLLTVNGPGHGAAYTQKSACVDRAVSAFFLNGTLPKETTCDPDPLPSE